MVAELASDSQPLTDEDHQLVSEAADFLRKHFRPGRHHVASIVKTTTGKQYRGLHLDVQGFDICAEPIVLSQVLADTEDPAGVIVSVIKGKDGDIGVVNPCGNCRQLLMQYTPRLRVIVDTGGDLAKVSVKDLLPYPY